MYATAAKVKELDYYTRLNIEFCSDLLWWLTFITGHSLFRWNTLQHSTTPPPPRFKLTHLEHWAGGCLWKSLASVAMAPRMSTTWHNGQRTCSHSLQLCGVGPTIGKEISTIPMRQPKPSDSTKQRLMQRQASHATTYTESPNILCCPL